MENRKIRDLEDKNSSRGQSIQVCDKEKKKVIKLLNLDTKNPTCSIIDERKNDEKGEVGRKSKSKVGKTLENWGSRLEDQSTSRGQESKYVIGISGRIEISGKSLVSYVPGRGITLALRPH